MVNDYRLRCMCNHGDFNYLLMVYRKSSSAAERKGGVTMTLRGKMQAVMTELNGEIAERDELIYAIALALLSESNLFILGDPGQAKSFAVNEFRKRITGAKQFERLLSKQTDEEALFGRLDLASLIPGAVPAQIASGDPYYRQMQQQLAAAMRPYSRTRPTPPL